MRKFLTGIVSLIFLYYVFHNACDNNTAPVSKTHVEALTDSQIIIIIEKVDRVINRHTDKAIFSLEQWANYDAAYNQGTTSLVELYQIANSAKDQAETAKYNIDNELNDAWHEGLPENVRNDLIKIVSNSSTSFYSRSEAFGLLLEYYDDPKPSTMSKFHEELALSADFLAESNRVLSLVKAAYEIPQ